MYIIRTLKDKGAREDRKRDETRTGPIPNGWEEREEGDVSKRLC